MKAAIRLTSGDLKTALSRALSARLARRSKDGREDVGLALSSKRGSAADERTTEGETYGKSVE